MTPEIRVTINAEIDSFLQRAEALAAMTIKTHRDAVSRVADLLLKKETLKKDELRAAIEAVPLAA